MGKKNKKEEEQIKECGCSQDCTCGCQEGKECTCNNECNCNEECECHSQEECHCGCHNNEETMDILSKRIKTLEDALLRSQAELLNYRKRKDEETARIIKYAEEDILKGLLPIVDNFERAIAMDDNNFGDTTSKFLEGFRMVYNQTIELLKKFEVKEIACLGQEFDPSFEQAISTKKDETKPAGTVLSVYQKGYTYKDRVLRSAMVIVNE